MKLQNRSFWFSTKFGGTYIAEYRRTDSDDSFLVKSGYYDPGGGKIWAKSEMEAVFANAYSTWTFLGYETDPIDDLIDAVDP